MSGDQFIKPRELTIESIRNNGMRFCAFLPEEWLKTLEVIKQAGGSISEDKSSRYDLGFEIDAILEERERPQQYLSSAMALQEARDLAVALKQKLTDVTETAHRSAALGSPAIADEYRGMERAIIKGEYGKLLSTLDRLITGVETEIEERNDARSGRPRDWFTRYWCARLSRFIEKRFGIPNRDHRGRVNPKMVDLLDFLWALAKPPIGGRNHRRAIQIALSDLLQQRLDAENASND